MDANSKTIQAVQNTLRPFVKSREEATHIRQLLSANLDSCLRPDPATTPLALLDESSSVEIPRDVRGLHRDYLNAVEANLQARGEYDAVRAQLVTTEESPSTPGQTERDHIEDHISKIKLLQKQARLEAVERYLDMLNQKPASSSDFLEPDLVFSDCRPLPDVPEEVINSLTTGGGDPKTDLKSLIDQLDKSVLRAKLFLKREEQMLADVKSRSNISGSVADSAKLHALGITRNELIHWIETELGKAGDGVGESEESPRPKRDPQDHQSHIDKKLAIIQEKYARYIAARKSLLGLVSQSPQPLIKPETKEETLAPVKPASPEPVTYLLSPYLERLLAIAREQKGLIAQKSYLNSSLASQLKELSQSLDHLAEESQLLPQHPPPGYKRRKMGVELGLGTDEKMTAVERVKPWAFGADSAKIATLESVTEKIEEGQVALEDSMKVLQEIDQLLGREGGNDSLMDAETTDTDIWLAAGGRDSSSPKAGRKAGNRGPGKKDIWSALDGNLGLINSGDNYQ